MSHLLKVRPASRPLRGIVPVASDKSIGHRALMLAALADDVVEIKRFTYGEDNVSTLAALRSMGVQIEDDSKGSLKVHGVGLRGLREPNAAIDCGNSGTTMRLLAGLLAAQPFKSTLIGDASLTRRPMARIVNPLRRRGAAIEGAFHPTKAGEVTAPLSIGPLPHGAPLGQSEEVLAVASAQVKSALLLSGLFAEGDTFVREPVVSRDHTERMLRALGAPLSVMGTMVSLEVAGWTRSLPAFSIEIPGDLSAAAFLLVAAQLVPQSEVRVRGCGINPTRSGILDVLRDAGALLAIEQHGDVLGEPVGDVTSVFESIRGGLIAGETATRAIDEIPVACALAARANGVTEIADVGELRVKESDRIATMTGVLRSFGIDVEERPDGMVVQGKPSGPLRAADVDSHGDHRVAMTAALLGLLGDGETVVRDVDCIATSFPRFVGTMVALGADISVESA
ncbi:MAG: 3-phosphoshikimate 1-carboxyvinyltransferase [Polyangiaceae bacterium]